MSGPYFKGQQPSDCGHYYPDVLRLRDERKADGKYVRVIDCAYCGRYEFEIDLQALDLEIAGNLLKQGYDPGVEEAKIAEIRAQRKQEFLSRGE